jgi:hypothetical protein
MGQFKNNGTVKPGKYRRKGLRNKRSTAMRKKREQEVLKQRLRREKLESYGIGEY